MALVSGQGFDPKTLADDGGWCWFHEPRIIAVGPRIWFGSVSSGWRDPGTKGNLIAYEWQQDKARVVRHVLGVPSDVSDASEVSRWANDHNAPALLRLPSGVILAVYTLHGNDNRIRYRRFFPVLRRWSAEKIFRPSPASVVTYSNLVYLRKERRVYNFFRGLDGSWKPSWMYSDTDGRSWHTGGILIDFPHPRKHRPYLKVSSNGNDQIHFAYTEAHPRDFQTSVYHVVYKSAVGLTTTDGRLISSLKSGLSTPGQGSLVFAGDTNHTPWVIAVNLYTSGRLFVLFSVRNGRRPQAPGGDVSDLDYFVAEWRDHEWKHYFVAKAGPQIYAGEDDYTGLFSQDSGDPQVVFISTRICPLSAELLPKWEIFRGETTDFTVWSWSKVTSQSEQDNIRPLAFSADKSGLIWLRGSMRTFNDYEFRVIAVGE